MQFDDIVSYVSARDTREQGWTHVADTGGAGSVQSKTGKLTKVGRQGSKLGYQSCNQATKSKR